LKTRFNSEGDNLGYPASEECHNSLPNSKKTSKLTDMQLEWVRRCLRQVINIKIDAFITQTKTTKNWLTDLKANIKSTQIKALAVNSSLIQLYWEMGKQIVEKQENAKWGSLVLSN
jgi:hypothetical protein